MSYKETLVDSFFGLLLLDYSNFKSFDCYEPIAYDTEIISNIMWKRRNRRHFYTYGDAIEEKIK